MIIVIVQHRSQLQKGRGTKSSRGASRVYEMLRRYGARANRFAKRLGNGGRHINKCERFRSGEFIGRKFVPVLYHDICDRIGKIL